MAVRLRVAFWWRDGTADAGYGLQALGNGALIRSNWPVERVFLVYP
jgi:hypothetical protein